MLEVAQKSGGDAIDLDPAQGGVLGMFAVLFLP